MDAHRPRQRQLMPVSRKRRGRLGAASSAAQGLTTRRGPGRQEALALLVLALSACSAPELAPSISEPQQPASLNHSDARMDDGYRLPLDRWPATAELANGQPEFVVLGLHGFNDYREAIAPLAQHLADAGMTTYAVDQRGFGATSRRGRWHGSDRLIADLHSLLRLIRQRHPDDLLFVAGDSMGAAVVLSALSESDPRDRLDVDGLILIAPAVWSRETMPWYQRLALAIAAKLLPGLELTGEGLSIRPSDNRDMLVAMGRDPLVIKATRVEALWGVTNLMDRAVQWSGQTKVPVLILYGENDEIIPASAFCSFISKLPRSEHLRLVLYRNGWHMLARDLQGERVHRDIATWIKDPTARLPSGEETDPKSDRIDAFCAASDTEDHAAR